MLEKLRSKGSPKSVYPIRLHGSLLFQMICWRREWKRSWRERKKTGKESIIWHICKLLIFPGARDSLSPPQFSGTKVHKWRPEVIFSSLWSKSCVCFAGHQFPSWVPAAKQQTCVLFLTPWHSATFHCSQLKTTLVGNTYGKPRKATTSKAIGSGTGKFEIGLYWSAPPFIPEVSTWEVVFDIHIFSFKSSPPKPMQRRVGVI